MKKHIFAIMAAAMVFSGITVFAYTAGNGSVQTLTALWGMPQSSHPSPVTEYRVQKNPDLLVSEWPPPPVTPPLNEHPRVFFTKDKIPQIMQKALSEENTYARTTMQNYVDYELAADGLYSTTVLAAIETKAFYYAVYGDESVGRDALSGVDVIAAIDFDYTVVSDYCRRYGRMINVLAEVYDWCYDLMGHEEKEKIINLCLELCKDKEHMEMSWPPKGQGAVTGHGSEAQLLRDYMSFAIAVYDERPDIWNYVGGRFYAEFVPAREFANAGHYTHQGTNYGYYREAFTAIAYQLIVGMGAPPPYPTEDQTGTAFSEIYMKRPDGNVFYDGDIYTSRKAPFAYYAGGGDEKTGLLIRIAASNDGYLKGEYLKRVSIMSNGNIIQSYPNNSPVFHLMLYDPELQIKTTATLPTAKYFGSPYGIMAARTSWQEGTDSESVAAFMKIGEYMYNNHQHLDSGNFEIYYKGLLAAEGGIYNIYGTDEHYMYTSKTVAHNCLLVHDPNEPLRSSDGSIINRRSNINDGGQRAVYNYNEVSLLQHVTTNPGLKHAEISAHEIDPKHTQKPEYTYLKGDLTDSYTSKVSKYTRSFMFLDLKDKDIPAALIVYDYVKSSDKTFKKTWLLHGLQKPVIDENSATAVFENKLDNGYGQNGGKMELKTLLPKKDNISMINVGGEDEGFGIINQYKYENETWKITESKNYSVDNTEGNESNVYRLEVSPKTASEEDCFFNIITIGDQGKNISVDSQLIDTGAFYGTVIKDRAIFFAKNSSDNISFSANMPNGDYKYTICDMQEGEYSITTPEGSFAAYASADGNVLSFDACGGIISIARTGNTYIAPADAEYDTNDDVVYVKSGSRFIRQARLGSGDFEGDVPLDALSDAFGYSVRKNEDVYLVEYDGIAAARISAGNIKAVTSSGMIMLSKAPYEMDGKLYLKAEDLYSLLSFGGKYLPYAKTIYTSRISSLPDGTAATATAYEGNGSIRVNAKISSKYITNLFCGVYSGKGYLIGGGMMTNLGGGKYTITTDSAADADKIYIYSWGDDLIPFTKPVGFKSYDASKIEGTWCTATDTLEFRAVKKNIELTKGESGLYIAKKISTSQEASIASSFGSNKLGEDGYILTSSTFKVNKKAGINENMQMRIRGYSQLPSTFRFLSLASSEGDECLVNSIIDLKQKMIYFYVNGKRVQSSDLNDWVFDDGSLGRVSGLEFYFVSSKNVVGSEFEIWNSYAIKFSGSASVDEIEEGLGNIIIKNN